MTERLEIAACMLNGIPVEVRRISGSKVIGPSMTLDELRARVCASERQAMLKRFEEQDFEFWRMLLNNRGK